MFARYKIPGTLVRALAHGMCTGLVTAFFVRYSAWGFFGLCLPLCIEGVQLIKDRELRLQDRLWDIAEHVTGGVAFGLLFYLT